MALPSNINRTDASTTIPDDYSNELLQVTFAQSAALTAFPRINLGTKVTNYPLIATLPTAGFVTENVDDSSGQKPTSKMTWKNKQITAEEIAVIVPVHENVLEDSTVDMWAQITPAVAEAFGAKIDDAILFGNGKPSSWRNGLIPTYKAGGQIRTYTAPTSGHVGDLVDEINRVMAFVEQDGNDVSTWFAGPRFRSKLRGLRNANGDLLYSDVRTGTTGELYGAPVQYVKNGTWADNVALLAGVDASKVRIGYRTDMTYKVLDQATLGTGTDQINLAERDMVALRVKMRLGWEIANNATRLSSDPTSGAVLVASAGNS